MHLLFCTALLFSGQSSDVPLRFEVTSAGTRIIARLPAETVANLPLGRLTQEQGETILVLSLLTDNATGPSILGKYDRNGAELTFTPRFSLSPGATYRASLKAAGSTSTLDYQLPKIAAKTPPKILKIYPSTDVLPANQLRFYIYFDRPMRGGSELFKHLVLLDEQGKEVDEPWLIEEVWDEANNCLIFYIHPGRIKWGVELRQLMGPVLHEKRSYTLVVRGEWTDLEGTKIGSDTIKKFRTTPEDRTRIELSDWKITAPTVGTREALSLTPSKSIDYRSLQTGLKVIDTKGQVVAGTIAIGQEEKSWHFTPELPWQAGFYHLDVSPDLEDVAGNTPSRPFDMNLSAPKLEPQKLRLKFTPH